MGAIVAIKTALLSVIGIARSCYCVCVVFVIVFCGTDAGYCCGQKLYFAQCLLQVIVLYHVPDGNSSNKRCMNAAPLAGTPLWTTPCWEATAR